MRNPPIHQQPARQARQKRYGWSMLYDDCAYHPKWLVVEAKSGVPVAIVVAIVMALFNAASKNHKNRANGGIGHGWVGNFDFDVCAAAFKLPREQPVAAYRALVEMGWIVDDYIVDWAARQATTDEEEAIRTGNRERQARRRARDDARKRLDLGIATPEEAELIKRLAAISRVTAAQEVAPRPARIIKAFERVASTNRDREADLEAERATETAAREWLFGNGVATDLGIASFIIAEIYGVKELSADTKIVEWAKQVDVVRLASIISSAFEHQPQLTRDNFKRIVEGAIDQAAKEIAAGPALPLEPVRVRQPGHTERVMADLAARRTARERGGAA